MSHSSDVIREYKGVSPTLQAVMGTGGNRIPLTMRLRSGKPGGGKGVLLSDKSQYLGTKNDQFLFDKKKSIVVSKLYPTLTARDWKGLTTSDAKGKFVIEVDDDSFK